MLGRCLALDENNVTDIQRRLHVKCKFKSIGRYLLHNDEHTVTLVIHCDQVS